MPVLLAPRLPAPFPIKAFRLGILVMIALMLASIALTWRVGQNIRDEMRAQVEVITATHKVEHYGSLLELSIKAVVASGDREAAARYRTIQPALRQTLSELRRSLADAEAAAYVERVDDADLALISLEYQALDLANQGQLEPARRIIHSQRYDYLVDVYEKGVQAIEKQAGQFVTETRNRLNFYMWTIIALSGTSLVLVIVGWIAFVRPVRRWGSEIEAARLSAEQAAVELEANQKELESLNHRLYRQARVDPLTGLATRLSFNEDAPNFLLGEVAPNQFYAVMCDVDYFKQFNDSKGHLAGDQALQLVAGAIRESINPDDTAYRLGGEEFLVVIHAASIRAARARAERLRAAVSELGITHPESSFGLVTISLGVAGLDRARGMSVERWLGLADEALYAAKTGGRNRVACGPAPAGAEQSGPAQGPVRAVTN